MSEDAHTIDNVHPCHCCGLDRDGYTKVCGCSYQTCLTCYLCMACCELAGDCKSGRNKPQTAIVKRAPEPELTPYDVKFLKSLKVSW